MVNYLGRTVEVAGCKKDGGFDDGSPTVLPGDGTKVALHVDDRGGVRFRPTEYGWGWSGAFGLTQHARHKKGGHNSREMTCRLRNELTGSVIIVAVEFGDKDGEGGRVGMNVVFRTQACPPFRLENHTLQPLCMYQRSERRGGGERGEEEEEEGERERR